MISCGASFDLEFAVGALAFGVLSNRFLTAVFFFCVASYFEASTIVFQWRDILMAFTSSCV